MDFEDDFASMLNHKSQQPAGLRITTFKKKPKQTINREEDRYIGMLRGRFFNLTPRKKVFFFFTMCGV